MWPCQALERSFVAYKYDIFVVIYRHSILRMPSGIMKQPVLLLLWLSAFVVAPSLARCPEGWKAFDGHCYRLTRSSHSYDWHKDYCESEGAAIVSIHSHEENKFVYEDVTNFINSWTGVHRDDTSSSNWYWADGSKFDFFNWKMDYCE